MKQTWLIENMLENKLQICTYEYVNVNAWRTMGMNVWMNECIRYAQLIQNTPNRMKAKSIYNKYSWIYNIL